MIQYARRGARRDIVPFTASVAFLAGVLITVLVIPAPGEGPHIAYRPAHASACRVLHAIAHTRRQVAEAVLACEHPDPDVWLGQVNVRTAGR